MSSLGFDSLRVKRRWCGILLKVTWLLTAIAASIGFHTGIRTRAFWFSSTASPVILVEMMCCATICCAARNNGGRLRRQRETSMSAAESKKLHSRLLL